MAIYYEVIERQDITVGTSVVTFSGLTGNSQSSYRLIIDMRPDNNILPVITINNDTTAVYSGIICQLENPAYQADRTTNVGYAQIFAGLISAVQTGVGNVDILGRADKHILRGDFLNSNPALSVPNLSMNVYPTANAITSIEFKAGPPFTTNTFTGTFQLASIAP